MNTLNKARIAGFLRNNAVPLVPALVRALGSERDAALFGWLFSYTQYIRPGISEPVKLWFLDKELVCKQFNWQMRKLNCSMKVLKEMGWLETVVRSGVNRHNTARRFLFFRLDYSKIGENHTVISSVLGKSFHNEIEQSTAANYQEFSTGHTGRLTPEMAKSTVMGIRPSHESGKTLLVYDNDGTLVSRYDGESKHEELERMFHLIKTIDKGAEPEDYYDLLNNVLRGRLGSDKDLWAREGHVREFLTLWQSAPPDIREKFSDMKKCLQTGFRKHLWMLRQHVLEHKSKDELLQKVWYERFVKPALNHLHRRVKEYQTHVEDASLMSTLSHIWRRVSERPRSWLLLLYVYEHQPAQLRFVCGWGSIGLDLRSDFLEHPGILMELQKHCPEFIAELCKYIEGLSNDVAYQNTKNQTGQRLEDVGD